MAEHKTPTEIIAELEQRAETIKNRIAQIKARQKTANRKKDNHRKIIIGANILAEMRADANFKAYVLKILEKRVVRKIEKEALADLFQTGAQG